MYKIVNLIRQLYENTVIIVDDYDNYYIYDRDVYVVYYLTRFTIKKYKNTKFIKNNIDYLNYLIKILRDNNINYVVLVKRFGYNVDMISCFNNNNYISYYKKGKLIYKRIKDIDNIRVKLKLNILDNKEKINEIKRLVDSYV